MITLKAYGISEVSIGSIAGLTLHRGGNDTSFNRDKQPLSINVSLEIINLIDGCAAYDKTDSFERSAIDKSLKPKNENNVYFQTGSTLLQTPGKIIQSLSPFRHNNLNATELGLDGNFSRTSKVTNSGLSQVPPTQTPTLQKNTKSNINIPQSSALNATKTAQENVKKIQNQLGTTVDNKKRVLDSGRSSV